MATIISDRVYTPDDLLSMPDGDRFELVNGQLLEGQMGAIESWVANLIAYHLTHFTFPQSLGMVLSENAQYQCFPTDPHRIRKPDVSFIQSSRVTNEIMRGFIKIPPDVAVEVVSPNDTYYEVEDKVAEYLTAGVRLVWVANPSTKTIRVHRPEKDPYEVAVGEELTGDEILQEFRVAVKEIFAPPASDATEKPL
jgi:Uma2 family endonuclease